MIFYEKLNVISGICLIAASCISAFYIAVFFSVQVSYYLFIVFILLLLNLPVKKAVIIFITTGFVLGICLAAKIEKNDRQVKSLIKEDNICLIQGIVISESVPSENDYYNFTILVEHVKSDSIISSAFGKTSVFIKSDFVEKPDSDITLTRTKQKRVIIEKGARLYFTGKYRGKKGYFYAEKACFVGWNTLLSKIRAYMRLRLKKILLSWGDAGSLMIALVTGTREFVPVNLRNNFTYTGIAHILALSGMHLAIIGSFIKKLFKPFFGDTSAKLLTVITCGFFLWFAGISPSLLRAFICLSISVFCELYGINVKKIFILLLSFLIQVTFFTEHALTLSFLLSYTGLGGIYLFMEYFRYLFTRYMRFSQKIAESLAVSTAAQCGILPVSIFCLKQIVPVGIFTTICVSPFISLFFILGIFGIIFSLVLESAGTVFSFILNIIYAIICKIIDFFTIFPPVNL